MLTYTSRLLIIILLLSGLIKFSTHSVGINIYNVLVPLFLMLCLCIVFVKRRVSFNSPTLMFLIFFISTGVIFLCNYAYYDNNYTIMQLFIAILMQSILPISLIMIACSRLFDHDKDSFYYVTVLLTKITIISLFYYLIAISVDYQSVLNFYTRLTADGLIANPLQTSEAGISLRFSGVFNSAFLLASFCSISISYYYYNRSVGKIKFLVIYSILFLIVFMTYNRNGMIAYLICTAFMLAHYFLNRYYCNLVTFYFYTIIIILCVMPGLLLLYGSSIFGGFSNYGDQSALTKVSTFLSRIDAWVLVLNIDDVKSLLFGTGLVQGLGDSNESFYVDNGYLYLLNQGGILLLIFYILSWVAMFSSLIRGLHWCSENYALKNEISMCLQLIVVSMTIAFLNNLFFEPIFLILVFMKCITITNKMNIYYEKK